MDISLKQIFDGKYHHLGPLVFDQNLHGLYAEPGYLRGIKLGLNYIRSTLHSPLTLDYYKHVHQLACSHFTPSNSIIQHNESISSFRFRGVNEMTPMGTINIRVLGYDHEDLFILGKIVYHLILEGRITSITLDNDDTTKFRILSNPNHRGRDMFFILTILLLDHLHRLIKIREISKVGDKYMSIYDEDVVNLLNRDTDDYQPILRVLVDEMYRTNTNPVRTTLDDKVRYLNNRMTKMHGIPLARFEATHSGIRCAHHLINSYTCMFSNHYLEETVQELLDTFEKSKKDVNNIARLFQNLQWLHPFIDGQGRTDLLILSKLLNQMGTGCILDEPYYSIYNSYEDWVEYLKLGIKRYEQELLNTE